MIPSDAISAVDMRLEGNGNGSAGGSQDGHVDDTSSNRTLRTTRRTWIETGNDVFRRFTGVKRRRRLPLKFPTKRHLLPVRVADRLRSLFRDETPTDLTHITRPKSGSRNSSKDLAEEDAVVPRCEDSSEECHGDNFMLTLATTRRHVIDLSSSSAAATTAASCYLIPQPPQHPTTHPAPSSTPQPKSHLSSGDHLLHLQHHQQQQQQQLATPSGRVPSQRHLINIPIPDDPRLWSRLDVRTWLDHVTRAYDIRDLDPDRFPMNGKGLCIMTLDMFLYRVPRGGVQLFRDFQTRFGRALHVSVQ